MRMILTLLIVSLAYTQQVLGSYEINDFNTRAANIEKLHAIYSKFLITNVYDNEARGVLMDQFLKAFENTFNNTDTWMNNAFLNGTLINNYIIEVDYNQRKIDDFLTRAITVENTAIEMHFFYTSRKNNRTKAVELIQFKQTVNDNFREITNEIFDNLRWTFIKQDITNWANKSDTDVNSLINLLKTNYGDENWLVLQYKNGSLKTQCEENTFRFEITNTTSQIVTLVVMATPGVNDISSKASIYQRKIATYYDHLTIEGSSPMYNCWTSDIETMSSYQCSNNIISFFGTFGVPNIINLLSTKEDLMKKLDFSKRIQRNEYVCNGFSLTFA